MSDLQSITADPLLAPQDQQELPSYTPIRIGPAFQLLRGAVVVLLLLITVTLRLPVQRPALLWITFALAAISVPVFYLQEQRRPSEERLFRWAVPAVDLVLAALLNLSTGGAASPFFPLFYLPTAYAGLLGGYIGGLAAALAAAAAYAALYITCPPRPELWMALIVGLLFPMAGVVSGYLGSYFAWLNRRGQGILEQAQKLHREVEDRRVLYERWYRAVDRLKADFVYSASHELRTPLTPVKGYLQMLLSPGLDMPADKVHEVMRIMSKNVDTLAQLVDDILYLQRVTRIPIDLEEVTLGLVAKQAVEEVSGEMEEAKVQIHLEEEAGLPPVLGSGDSLRLVLTNLLETVIRDSPEGGEVGLALRAGGGGVEVRISGAGRGIPVEQQERIFDLFFHADSSPTYVLGREGLSLAIARYIVEMHGGKIAVESQPRGGMAFTVQLPGRT